MPSENTPRPRANSESLLTLALLQSFSSASTSRESVSSASERNTLDRESKRISPGRNSKKEKASMALNFYDASDVRMISTDDEKENVRMPLSFDPEGRGCDADDADDADDESSAGTVAFNVHSWQSMPGCAKGSVSQGQGFGYSSAALFGRKSTRSHPDMPLGRPQRQAALKQHQRSPSPYYSVGSPPSAHF